MLNQQDNKFFAAKDQKKSLLNTFAVNDKFCQAIANHPNILVIVQDRLGKIIYLNEACERIVGLTLDQVKGKCIWDLCMIPEEVEITQAIFQQVLSGKYPLKNHSYLVDKNGNSYLISWLNTTLSHNSNAVEYVISVGFHVTSNFPTLQTAQSEWESQRRFSAFFDQSSELMALLRPDGQFIEANQSLLDFSDLKLLDIAGKYLWEMHWWADSGTKTRAQLKEMVEQAARGESVSCEINLLGKNESARVIDFSLKPFRDETGKVVMLIFESRDITEKKYLEAQVLRLQRLENIGMLANSIVHDIRNILTPVLGIAHLLKHRYNNADVETHKLLDMLQTNVKQSTEVVKLTLLFFGGVEEKRTEMQLGDLISEFKDFAEIIFPKSIKIHTYIPPNLWLISGDVTQLHQLFMNLCINARDSMPKGGTLSISAENLFIDQSYVRISPDAKTGAYVELTVFDTGNGIHPEILDQIFEPSFITKELDDSTGLGLSTVKTIVKDHGGFINTYSKLGEGTIFKICLPALQQESDIQTSRETLHAGNGELILIVDREPTICYITKTTLETYGYQALIASDGIEAIALYAQYNNQINAVLIDITMPLINSENAIHIIFRKINPQIKIIALSGFNCVNKRIVAMEDGVRAFLSKPYTTETLLQTIHEVLHEKG